ncbi:MAG: DUF4350 domain-containing protein [Oculatellaceae cyanobacterium Prado106]|jgi:hypothetical protein|nr:DUF4350 domain-containing protein [Oculatellaceae cyanobacterium Prado106]
MKPLRRWGWVGVVLVPLLVLMFFINWRTPEIMQGSTYSRTPTGYGAWYAAMQAEGVEIQRWQRSLSELDQIPEAPTGVEIANRYAQTQGLITFVGIATGNGNLQVPSTTWIEQGNTVVLLGQRSPVTQAPFSSQIPSPVGAVKIETRRRYRGNSPQQNWESSALLKDQQGAVVWTETVGKGQIIYASTSLLAANAYQDEAGNFKFLSELVKAPGHPIWVDEYLHGYRDRQSTAESEGSVLEYLVKTPFLVIAIQGLMIMGILVWAKNRRLGPALKVVPPTQDNSESYIQALAGVLQKANCSDFVLETLGKAERGFIQRSLGLGSDPVDPQVLITAWEQQTGRSAAELEAVLHPAQRPNSKELLTWLAQVKTIHRLLGHP